MSSSNLIRVLREVPECRLRLIELSWKVVGDDGKVDLSRLTFYSKEIEEALAEAEAYREATRKAVRCLMEHFQF
jgi:hypothetical protein